MRPSCTCTKRLRLLDLNSGNCMNCKIYLFPAGAWRDAEDGLGAIVLLARRRSRQPGCFASGESQGRIRRGKFTFPWDFPGLSWARSPQTFRNPSAAGGACLSIPTKQVRQLRVQGGHRPGGVWGETPSFLFVGIMITLEKDTLKNLEEE